MMSWILVLLVLAVIAIAIVRSVRRNEPPQKQPRPYRLTEHARQRMVERHVNRDLIETVLAQPTRFVPDTGENSVRLELDYVDRVLKVWVVAPWPTSAEVVVKSVAWKYQEYVTIPTAKIGRVIGRGGNTVQQLRDSTGAHIQVQSNGRVYISAGDQEATRSARQQIVAIAS